MHKILIASLILIASTAQASEKFSTASNTVTTSIIKWLHVDNVYQVCDQESRRRGNGGFARLGQGKKMDGCSFWEKTVDSNVNSCTIVTDKATDHDTVGHEVRHCFQGNFHK